MKLHFKLQYLVDTEHFYEPIYTSYTKALHKNKLMFLSSLFTNIRTDIKRQTDSTTSTTSGQTDITSGQFSTTNGQMGTTSGQTNTTSRQTSTMSTKGTKSTKSTYFSGFFLFSFSFSPKYAFFLFSN